MVVDGDGEGFLGALLADHVLVEDVLDLLRGRDLRDGFRNFAFLVLRQDLVAERDALVADVDRGPDMNFLTESFDLPQNEQRKCLSWDMRIRTPGDGERKANRDAVMLHNTLTHHAYTLPNSDRARKHKQQ